MNADAAKMLARWLAECEPVAMFRQLEATFSARCFNRQCRLAACLYARQFWPALGAGNRACVELAEDHADEPGFSGPLPGETIDAGPINLLALRCLTTTPGRAALYEWLIFRYSIPAAYEHPEAPHWHYIDAADLLREAFGPYGYRPPFRWVSRDLAQLSETIWRERRFSDLPILADAAEEAGCNDEWLLAHLRGMNPHPKYDDVAIIPHRKPGIRPEGEQPQGWAVALNGVTVHTDQRQRRARAYAERRFTIRRADWSHTVIKPGGLWVKLPTPRFELHACRIYHSRACWALNAIRNRQRVESGAEQPEAPPAIEQQLSGLLAARIERGLEAVLARGHGAPSGIITAPTVK